MTKTNNWTITLTGPDRTPTRPIRVRRRGTQVTWQRDGRAPVTATGPSLGEARVLVTMLRRSDATAHAWCDQHEGAWAALAVAEWLAALARQPVETLPASIVECEECQVYVAADRAVWCPDCEATLCRHCAEQHDCPTDRASVEVDAVALDPAAVQRALDDLVDGEYLAHCDDCGALFGDTATRNGECVAHCPECASWETRFLDPQEIEPFLPAVEPQSPPPTEGPHHYVAAMSLALQGEPVLASAARPPSPAICEERRRGEDAAEEWIARVHLELADLIGVTQASRLMGWATTENEIHGQVMGGLSPAEIAENLARNYRAALPCSTRAI